MAPAATPLPKEDSTPPVIKMILLFTSPLLYLAKPNVKVKSGGIRREKRRANQGADFRGNRGNQAQRPGSEAPPLIEGATPIKLPSVLRKVNDTEF